MATTYLRKPAHFWQLLEQGSRRINATIYRRHIKACAHRSEGRKYRRCRCPIWADGFIGSDEIRESLKTRDWEKAQGISREWEAEGAQTKDPEPVTIAQATQDFLRDAEARGLRPPTLYKYRLLFRQMETFAQAQGLRKAEPGHYSIAAFSRSSRSR